jgi:hypothetical protein
MEAIREHKIGKSDMPFAGVEQPDEGNGGY